MTNSGMTPRTEAGATGNLFTLLVFVSILLTFVLVVLSAYIRLGDTGLGCDDWPACFGAIGPGAEHYAAKSLAEGGPLLPPSLARTFHRLAATLLGLFVLAIAAMAATGRAGRGTGVLPPLLVLGLTVFLSILGYVTPSPLVPAVAVANILGGMLMLALLWWTGQRSVPASGVAVNAREQRLRPWARAGLVLLLAQITLGAWTSGNLAGPACRSLSGCEGAWSVDAFADGFTPTRVLTADAAGRVLANDAHKAVHMVHRLGALAVVLFLGWLAIQTRTAAGQTRSNGTALLALVAAQAGLGGLAIATGLPLAIVTLHNATAALLLLALTNLNHRLTPQPV